MKIDMGGIWQASDEPTKGYLLVVLHGRGDSAEGFEWLKDALDIPGLSLLLLNAPDHYHTGFSWYDLPPHQFPGIQRSRSLLEKTFSELFRQGFSPEKCFLLGFSQGCLMTLEFGARFPYQLAGYIGISGYCYDPVALITEAESTAMKGNWLITHGDADEVLPVERTRSQMRDLIDAGLPVEYREYPKSHTIDPREELPFLREWIRKRVRY